MRVLTTSEAIHNGLHDLHGGSSINNTQQHLNPVTKRFLACQVPVNDRAVFVTKSKSSNNSEK